MRIIIVEPHPDDAFLSLGWHIEKVWKGEEVIILTVYANERRAQEADAYCTAVGAFHACLLLEESKMDSEIKWVQAPQALKEWLDKNWDGYGTVLLPLGLQHPDHRRVASIKLKQPTSTDDSILYYVDTPYQTKQKLADTLLDKVDGMLVHSILFPPKRKWRHAPLFKSQAKFFHFNSRLFESLLPEIVLEKDYVSDSLKYQSPLPSRRDY